MPLIKHLGTLRFEGSIKSVTSKAKKNSYSVSRATEYFKDWNLLQGILGLLNEKTYDFTVQL